MAAETVFAFVQVDTSYIVEIVTGITTALVATLGVQTESTITNIVDALVDVVAYLIAVLMLVTVETVTLIASNCVIASASASTDKRILVALVDISAAAKYDTTS